MTTSALYSVGGIIIFAFGMHGLLTQPHLLRKTLALNVMSTGIFLFFIAMANRNPGGHPDPVPHAMVLTGIVVAVSGTALMLCFIIFFFELTGRTDLEFGMDDGENQEKKRRQ